MYTGTVGTEVSEWEYVESSRQWGGTLAPTLAPTHYLLDREIHPPFGRAEYDEDAEDW